MTELMEPGTIRPDLGNVYPMIWINGQFQQRKKEALFLSSTRQESQSWSGSLIAAALGPALNEETFIRKEINGHV